MSRDMNQVKEETCQKGEEQPLGKPEAARPARGDGGEAKEQAAIRAGWGVGLGVLFSVRGKPPEDQKLWSSLS